jgi:diguanylate cyclase (GGDEF)-like protein
LCKKIRGSLSNTITPIFLITGRLKKTYLDQAHEAGVTDFLSDQLDIEELEERIASGKKVTSMREKTEEASSALQVSKKEISKAYFKNKLLLHDHALRMLAAAKIENIPVILLFLRIDRFEEIQKDAFLAESILAELSELIVSQLSDFDLLIPYSEGQFILLLPNVLSERARHIAEHLRKEVARNRFETKKGPLYLTLSIAISSLEASEKAFQAMIETALKAFKQAKLATNLILSLDLERP